MASGDPSDWPQHCLRAQQLDASLRCSICSELFVAPKLLPCGHTCAQHTAGCSPLEPLMLLFHDAVRLNGTALHRGVIYPASTYLLQCACKPPQHCVQFALSASGGMATASCD